MRILPLFGAILIAFELEAQPVVVKRICDSLAKTCTTLPLRAGATDLELLEMSYFAGKMDAATTILRGLLDSTLAKRRASQALISFVTTPPGSQARSITTVLLAASDRQLRPIPARLSGLESVLHVLITSTPKQDISQTWTSEQQEDPVLADINKLALALAAGVGSASAVLAAQRADDETLKAFDAKKIKSDSLYVVIDSLTFPHKRAKLTFEFRISDDRMHASTLKAASRLALSSDALSSTTAGSECAEQVRSQLHTKMDELLQPRTSWLSREALDSLRGELLLTYTSTVRASPCFDAGTQQVAPGERLLAERVLSAITTVLARPQQQIVAKNTLVNAPWRYFAVGTVVGVPVGRALGSNYELESNLVARRPISGLLTSVVLHVHPRTDPTEFSPSLWRRFSAFGGVVVTPREGLIAGVSTPLWRGLGLQLSHAWMRANSLRDSSVVVGSAPPADGIPFRSRVIGRYNFGLSVKLQ